MEQCQWIKEKYNGILEIYPTKCLNTLVLQKKLHELDKDYELVQITNDWIRALRRNI